MLERVLLFLGGLEIIIGGLVTAYPTLLPQWVGLVMVAIGILTVASALYLIVADLRTTGGIRLGLVQQWALNPTFEDSVPFRRTILLTEAALRARDATVMDFFGEASERIPKSGNPLDYLATALGMPDKYESADFPGPLRLYGRRFNSTRRVLIPSQDRKTGIIEGAGATLRQPGENKAQYTHLEILRSEMRKRIRHLKTIGSHL